MLFCYHNAIDIIAFCFIFYQMTYIVLCVELTNYSLNVLKNHVIILLVQGYICEQFTIWSIINAWFVNTLREQFVIIKHTINLNANFENRGVISFIFLNLMIVNIIWHKNKAINNKWNGCLSMMYRIVPPITGKKTVIK